MFVTGFNEIAETLLKIRSTEAKILIVTHVRPDGDAIGTAAGLCTVLNENGWHADVLYHSEIPDSCYDFLPPAEHLVAPGHGFNAAKLNGNYTVLFSVDSSTPARTFINGILPEDVEITFLALDHHPDHKEYANITYVDGTAAAAAQIATQLAQFMNLEISPTAASQFLLGLATDSGCFKFDNTTATSHRIVADLMDCGANHHLVMEKAYFSKPVNMALFEADELCNHLHSGCGGKLAWLLITNETLQKHGIDIKNTEALVETVRQINGLSVAAVVKPTNIPGDFRLSLRSKDLNVSVGNIARKFGGGGHELAAGCNITAKDVNELGLILESAVQEEINRTKQGDKQ